jgi:hypothetical protein
MRWLVWTEGSHVLFIRLMEECPKGVSKAVTPKQIHSTGLQVQDIIIGDTEHLHEFIVHWTMNSTVVSVSHNPIHCTDSPMVMLQCVQVQCGISQLSLQREESENLGGVHLAYSAGLQYPRAVMQGSLHLDFKGLPYSFGPCKESLWRGGSAESLHGDRTSTIVV